MTITPNEFAGSDVERINQAIEKSAGTGARVVIPRVNAAEDGPREEWLLHSAILLRDNTTLELENCRLKLSDRCRDNFMRTANCGLGITDVRPMRNIHVRGVGGAVLEGADRPRATGDGAKTLGHRTYGTDAGVPGREQSGDWRNIGILMAFVEDFSIENLIIRDSHCWAISLERCAEGRLRDLRFASSGFIVVDGERQTVLNQDGIDLRMGCHDILIENVSGYTGDDLIALTAIARDSGAAGGTGTTMVTAPVSRGDGLDDIRHVIIRNVCGHCQGGHHIIRLLNTAGVGMYDILVDGLVDTSPDDLQCRAAVTIGADGYGGIAPLGDTTRIVIRNVVSRARNTIMVNGSLTDSIISGVIRHGGAGDVLTAGAGDEYVRDVLVSDVHVVDE